MTELPTPAEAEHCDQCGALLGAPAVPHTKRTCEECGRQRYRTATEKGLEIETGDQVVVPSAWLSVSLDPRTASGRLFRPGISWYVQQMFLSEAATKPEDVPATLEAYKETADNTMEQSELLADLDLDDPDQGDVAMGRIGNDFQKPEFWALRVGVSVIEAKRALGEGDTQQAAWAMQHAALSRCMLLFVQSLEELVWRGYRTFGVEELQRAIKVWDEAPSKTSETFWQNTLAEHSFVLSQLFAAPTLVIQGQAYVGGKGVDNRQGQITDFLAKNALTGAVALVEIKKPNTSLLGRAYRNGVVAPSTELVGAVAQGEGNRDTLVKEFYAQAKGQASFFPYDPPCIVIAGHTNQLDSEEKRRSFELFRRGLKDVRVATFDEVFGQARALLDLVQR